MVATPTTSLGFQNFFSTTLSADITDTATDVFLTSVPNVSEGFLVIEPDSTTNREVIYYTSKTALKVVCPSVADGRGQDDTTAHSHTSGVTVIMAPVAAYFEAMQTLFQTTPAGWTSITGSISAVTYNGNRSYSLTTSSDNSAVISPGMRLRTTRTVSAPTQVASLNGTNNYFSKTSPAGMTFTDDFTVSAWIKLSAYSATGSCIVSRYNGTSGWSLQLNTSGQVQFVGFNAGASNISYVQSYQSIPLNKWVHVTAQLDMSSFTATSTTSYVMIDGVDVPAFVARGGTNPTALVQAGNLEIGSQNGGATFNFSGKIAQVAIFNAKVTQATIRTYISQGLSGSETSLISAYSFNNSITDLNTTNANNLTNNNSTSITNADSPFGYQADGTISATKDYAIVQTVSASTLVVQVPEGCTIPTSGGVSACSYSSFKNPYGFPGQRGKWTVEYHLKILSEQTTPTGGTWYNPSTMKLNIPIGEWIGGYQVGYFGGWRTANISADAYLTLSTSSSSESNPLMTSVVNVEGASSTIAIRGAMNKDTDLSIAAATDYYLIIKSSVNLNAISIIGTLATTTIRAVNAYV